jgi:hypothetical protein
MWSKASDEFLIVARDIAQDPEGADLVEQFTSTMNAAGECYKVISHFLNAIEERDHDLIALSGALTSQDHADFCRQAGELKDKAKLWSTSLLRRTLE